MNDVASAVCDINIQVNRLNRVVRQTYATDVKELNETVNAIETFLKDIKQWCETKNA
jgi:outer membrane murein-binding lipoprotein Lpp